MEERTKDIDTLLAFDANHDGQVTKAELEAGLKAAFDAADKNHDGKLDAEEVRAENDRRFAADGTRASPLIDWNKDGVVDFDEFANALRTQFSLFDTNNDGILSKEELQVRPENPEGGRPNGGERRSGGQGQGPNSGPFRQP